MHCQACETQQRDAQHHIFQLDTFSILVRKQPHIVKVVGIQLYEKPGAMKQNMWLIFTDQPDTNQHWTVPCTSYTVDHHLFKSKFGPNKSSYCSGQYWPLFFNISQSEPLFLRFFPDHHCRKKVYKSRKAGFPFFLHIMFL